MAEASNTSRSDMIAKGVHAIKRLPISRRSGLVTPPPSLRDLLRLIEAYLASPSHHAPPTKVFLHSAVQSLLHAGTRLSTQWGKTQLSLVLKKWILSALRLDNYNAQPALLVQVKRNPKNAKLLSHKVFLRPEGSGETLTFFMTSPSPAKVGRAAKWNLSSRIPAGGVNVADLTHGRRLSVRD